MAITRNAVRDQIISHLAGEAPRIEDLDDFDLADLDYPELVMTKVELTAAVAASVAYVVDSCAVAGEFATDAVRRRNSPIERARFALAAELVGAKADTDATNAECLATALVIVRQRLAMEFGEPVEPIASGLVRVVRPVSWTRRVRERRSQRRYGSSATVIASVEQHQHAVRARVAAVLARTT